MRKPRSSRGLLLVGTAALVLSSGGCLSCFSGGDPEQPPPVDLQAAKMAHLLPPPLTPSQPINERVSFLTQQYMSIEDDKKVLVGRIQQAEAELQEKEKKVAETSKEVQITINDLKLAQEVLKHMKDDRDHLNASLKKNEEKLEKIWDEIEVLRKKRQKKGKDPGGFLLQPESSLAPRPLPRGELE